jgi:uncharacterized protein YjbJ (UPF0337 family)
MITRAPLGYSELSTQDPSFGSLGKSGRRKLKQGVGKVTGSKETQARGAAQEVKGKAQRTMGKAKSAVKDTANKVADKANKKL